MPQIQIGGQAYEVDEDGFLTESGKWSKEFAQGYAAMEGIEGELTEDHWKVINYIRDYYAQYGIAPMTKKLCKDCDFKLKDIYELFPSGPAKGACKLAGLSKPAGCV